MRSTGGSCWIDRSRGEQVTLSVSYGPHPRYLFGPGPVVLRLRARCRPREEYLLSGPKQIMRPTVLPADDHRATAEQLRTLLQPHFDVVALVEDGRDLVSAAARLTPDVIVTDISMPGLNGIEACARIRAVPPKLASSS